MAYLIPACHDGGRDDRASIVQQQIVHAAFPQADLSTVDFDVDVVAFCLVAVIG
jgi:hypothetical protein